MTDDQMVKVEFATKDGDTVAHVMTPTALVNLVSMAVALVNANTAQVLAEVSRVA